VQRVLDQVKTGDPGLGSLRPDAVAAILGEVEGQLDAARRLRLERDRWALRAPVLRAYSASVSLSLERLRSLTPLLEDIKTLAGSGPDAIGTILRRAEQIQTALGKLQPPDELRDVHALIASAAQLADNAAKIRREAAISGSIQRAWDASSAAAGALMLSARARTDIQAVLHPPQLPR
jgi:hypothetical protein